MKDWTSIGSFDRIHQAQLRRDILLQNNINAVILNEKDSAFLLGDIELMVENKDTERALALLRQFTGHWRINSFIRKNPVELVREIIERQYISVNTIEEFDPFLNAMRYQLYVPNADAPFVDEYFSNLFGWKLLITHQSESQLASIADVLSELAVDCIALKQKNEDFFVKEIQIWVKETDLEFAYNTIIQLPGWQKIFETSEYQEADLMVSELRKNEVEAIINTWTETDICSVWVEDYMYEKAQEILDASREWALLATLTEIHQAILLKAHLQKEGIAAAIITKKDSLFLIGDIEVYVDADQLERAKSIDEEFEFVTTSDNL